MVLLHRRHSSGLLAGCGSFQYGQLAGGGASSRVGAGIGRRDDAISDAGNRSSYILAYRVALTRLLYPCSLFYGAERVSMGKRQSVGNRICPAYRFSNLFTDTAHMVRVKLKKIISNDFEFCICTSLELLTAAYAFFSVSKIRKVVTGLKRENYLKWDEYFMGVALLSAQRSKDPSTQVGACIVGSDNRILSMGYNGCPADATTIVCMVSRRRWIGNEISIRLPCRTQRYFKSRRFKAERFILYTTLFPCNECAKAIIQSELSRSYIFPINMQKPIPFKHPRKCLI